jgi:hypothetical protein
MINEDAIEYANGDEKFAEWLTEINTLLESRLAVSLFDLPDMMFRDAYDAGNTPEEFIQDEIFPFIRDEYGEDSAKQLLD